jgi:hypothetical protein
LPGIDSPRRAFLPFGTAFSAEAVQADLVPGRSAARRLLKLLFQGTINSQTKTGCVPTALAGKVMVRHGGSLEPSKPDSRIESAHQPVFRRNAQVPIDCTQTQMWELPPHPVEQPLRRREAPGLSKDVESAITLSALASLFRHSPPSRLVLGIVTDYAVQPFVLSIGGALPAGLVAQCPPTPSLPAGGGPQGESPSASPRRWLPPSKIR